MLCCERVDYAAQRDIDALGCHAVILSAAERGEPAAAGRSGLFCLATAGGDASLRIERSCLTMQGRQEHLHS